jgi:hypothetical protein
VDACDAVAKENKEEASGSHGASSRHLQDRSRAGGRDGGGDFDDDDQGGYGGEGVVSDDEEY